MNRFLVFPLLAVQVAGHCPPTGPVLPPPTIPTDFKSAGLSSSLDLLAKGTDRFNSTTTSFSFSVTSPDSTFFEFHHTAPSKNASGVKQVDKDTVYRMASNTKMYMTLAVLLAFSNNLDDPIGKYIPELAASKDYEDVTPRLLAAHLAGVPRNGYVFDRFATAGPELENLGFPIPPSSEVPPCDYGAGARACSRAEFFASLTNDTLTSLPGERASYSNQGFNLLGFALEGKTGKPFQDVIRDTITTPLGLKTTGFKAPPVSQAIIPAGKLSVWYDLDISHFKATAGMYSTPADGSSFLRGILTSRLLSPARTRAWLKPTAFTSDLTTAVGMPWEIFRVPVPGGGRPVDLYTKSGDIGAYAAYAVLIPEYGVGVTINAAGSAAYRATALLLDLVVDALLPELDRRAREQARATFAGRYRAAPAAAPGKGTNATGSGSGADELVLGVDSGPGLRIQKWTSQGKDVFAGLAVLRGAKKASDVEARLYPIGDGGRWRMVMETPEDGKGMVETTCSSWMSLDQFRYAGLPVDEFDFKQTAGGAVQSIEALGLRQVFVR